MQPIQDPWKWEPVEESLRLKLLSQFKGEVDGYVRVGPKKYLFPQRFAEDGITFYNFEPRPSDTWIVTFPRSGTTLTQELVWVLSNNFDYKTAAEVPLVDRFPFLEFSACTNKKLVDQLLDNASDNTTKELIKLATDPILPALEKSTEPRFIKTHLPFSLLNPNLLTCGAKVIYVARNPKNVAISYYHLHKLFKTRDYTGNFEDFWNYFENDNVLWAPFWSHLNEAWDLRQNSNMLFLFYEELQQNMPKTIQRIASFLGKDVNQLEVDKLTRHLDISNFKKNPSVNFECLRELGITNPQAQGFVRQGATSKAGPAEMSPALEHRINLWTQNNLNNTTLRFDI